MNVCFAHEANNPEYYPLRLIDSCLKMLVKPKLKTILFTVLQIFARLMHRIRRNFPSSLHSTNTEKAGFGLQGDDVGPCVYIQNDVR